METLVAFALYVFVDAKRMPEVMRFRDINDCIYFSKKLHAQGQKITAYCIPEAITKDMKVY